MDARVVRRGRRQPLMLMMLPVEERPSIARKLTRTAITLTSVDAYTDHALKEWFDDRVLATDLQLSLNKNCWCQWGRISATTPSWGSKMQRRWTRHTRPLTSSTSDRRTEWRCGSCTTQFLSTGQRRRLHVPNCTASYKTIRSRRSRRRRRDGSPSRGGSQLCGSGARYVTSTRA